MNIHLKLNQSGKIMDNSKSRVLIVTLLLLMVSAQSCDIIGIGSASQPEVKLDIPQEYKLMGKLHNQGLDSVYKKMKTKTIEVLKEKGTTYKAGEKLNLDYHALVNEGISEFCSTNKYLKRGQKTIQKALTNYKAKGKTSLSEFTELENMSSEEKELINEIKKVLDDEYDPESLSKLKRKLNKINHKAAKNLSKRDAAAIYAGTSMAYHSTVYWMYNYKKWYFALNVPEILDQYDDKELNKLKFKSNSGFGGHITSASWDDWWDNTENWWESTTDEFHDWYEEDGENIIKSDVQGSVDGAMAGCAAGATGTTFVLPGGGTVTGCAAGALVGGAGVGLAGSGGTAVWEMFD